MPFLTYVHAWLQVLDADSLALVRSLREALSGVEAAFEAKHLPKPSTESEPSDAPHYSVGGSPSSVGGNTPVASKVARTGDGDTSASSSRYDVFASTIRVAAEEVQNSDLLAATDEFLRERFVPHVEVGVKVPVKSRQQYALNEALPNVTAWLSAEQSDKYVITRTNRQPGDMSRPNKVVVEGCVQYTGVTVHKPHLYVSGGSSSRPCRGGALAAALVHDRIQRLMYPDTPLARCCNFADAGEWQAVPTKSGRMGFALYSPKPGCSPEAYVPYEGASIHLQQWITCAWGYMLPELHASQQSNTAAEQAALLQAAPTAGLPARPFPVNDADTAAYDCTLPDGRRAMLYRGVKRIKGGGGFTVSSGLQTLGQQADMLKGGELFDSPFEAALTADSIVRKNQLHPELRLVNFAREPQEVQFLPCTPQVRSAVLYSLRERSQTM